MRLLLPALLVLAFAAVPAGASPRYDVSGPKVVHPGERVRFTVTGATPGEVVEVSLAPTINRGGNCCGVSVRGAPVQGSSGQRRLTRTTAIPRPRSP